MEITILGIGVSPGIAIGPALLFGQQTLEAPKHEIDDPEREIERFKAARKAVRDELIEVQQQVARDLDEQHANIFLSHIMAVDDVEMENEIVSRVRSERTNVEYLVDDFIGRHSRILEAVHDSHFRERMHDFVDVGRRILSHLLDKRLNGVEHLDHPSIVVAHELAPSHTANLDLDKTLGIATDLGGPTSHTAILARALEIPAVVGVRTAVERIRTGDPIIVDGNRGIVIVNPSDNTLAECRRLKEKGERDREAQLRIQEGLASATADGIEIPTMANIELPFEIAHCLRVKAMGVGLYRTEYLFMNRPELPDEEEQFEAYENAVRRMNGAPVTLRTLDLGGEKMAMGLAYPKEDNPQLGWRAIRMCLERPEIFKVQLRAMLRASAFGNVQILFPLVSGIEEFRRAKALLFEARDELDERGIPYGDDIKLGTMIEVPSAVAVADVLARECDYFSLGTNDLIQYTLAVDRANEKIGHMYQPAHPGILRMIRYTAKAAKEAGISCAICGEMASDPLFTEALIGMGVDRFSMAPVSIPVIRAEIARVTMATAQGFAEHLLTLGTVQEVTDALTQRYDRAH